MTGLEDVRLHVMRTILERGAAPTAPETAAALGLTERDAAGAYRSLAEAHVIVLRPGSLDVWMANPLSAVPTAHVAEVAGRSHFANCIWDVLGTVAMLGGTGVARTRCGDCDEPLEVRVEGGAVAEATGRTVHFAVPAARWWEDIGFT